jgi:hypothetical protein
VQKSFSGVIITDLQLLFVNRGSRRFAFSLFKYISSENFGGKTQFMLISRLCISCVSTRYASHNDISVNDGPHLRRWSHKIIVPLCYNSLQYSVELHDVQV